MSNAFTEPRKPLFTPQELRNMKCGFFGSVGARKHHERTDTKAGQYLKPPGKDKPR